MENTSSDCQWDDETAHIADHRRFVLAEFAFRDHQLLEGLARSDRELSVNLVTHVMLTLARFDTNRVLSSRLQIPERKIA